MVLVMGISFRAPHYYLGGSATAPRLLPIMAVLLDQGDSYLCGPLCLLWGAMKTDYGGGKECKRFVSDSLEKRSP